MKRREFLAALGGAAVAMGHAGVPRPSGQRSSPAPPPNIILIVADDLGYGELGCYGQKKIRTPHLDRLAAEGVRFTQSYSGSPVCAPSRCVLLTGRHTGHAYIRDNDELSGRGDVWNDPALEGQRPLLDGTVTLASLLKKAGCATAACGKWGLGGPGTTGEPSRQGFDHFYGYLCQRLAHNYYPVHLWRDGRKEILEGNTFHFARGKLAPGRDPLDRASYAQFSGKQYSLDLIAADARAWIQAHRPGPFFLFLPFTVPHLALQVPEDSFQEYAGAFPETPYLGEKGYLPHWAPRAAYAAMISRLDREVGRLMALLKDLGLDERTLVLFSSDNGATIDVGGADTDFFASNAPLRGKKTMVYEGGIRVPLIARWPGRIKPGRVNGHLCAFEDYLPTFCEAAGVAPPVGVDGVSFLPTLLGEEKRQARREYLYWEFQGRQAVRRGDWKGIRDTRKGTLELYNLAADAGESSDLAAKEPAVVREIAEIMRAARTESELFPLLK